MWCPSRSRFIKAHGGLVRKIRKLMNCCAADFKKFVEHYSIPGKEPLIRTEVVTSILGEGKIRAL